MLLSHGKGEARNQHSVNLLCYHPWTKARCLLRASFMSLSTEGSLSLPLRAQGPFLTFLDRQSHPSWDLCGWLDTLTYTLMKERQLEKTCSNLWPPHAHTWTHTPHTNNRIGFNERELHPGTKHQDWVSPEHWEIMGNSMFVMCTKPGQQVVGYSCQLSKLRQIRR